MSKASKRTHHMDGSIELLAERRKTDTKKEKKITKHSYSQQAIALLFCPSSVTWCGFIIRPFYSFIITFLALFSAVFSSPSLPQSQWTKNSDNQTRIFAFRMETMKCTKNYRIFSFSSLSNMKRSVFVGYTSAVHDTNEKCNIEKTTTRTTNHSYAKQCKTTPATISSAQLYVYHNSN